jgi:hypothetical protein
MPAPPPESDPAIVTAEIVRIRFTRRIAAR